MNLFNLLTPINVYEGGFGDVVLKGLNRAIQFIIEQPKLYSVAVGIILFTLALKLITLPFDIISRASTKKNSLKMEKMRPELERMQKQFANNKELYQKKMMALYKKEGYSQFAACLPSLITIVFFFIVISGFNTYSRYAQKHTFNQMAIAYTDYVKDLANDENNGYVLTVDDKYYLDKNSNSKYAEWVRDNFTFLTYVQTTDGGVNAEYSVNDVASLYSYLQDNNLLSVIGEQNFNAEHDDFSTNVDNDKNKTAKQVAIDFESVIATDFAKQNVNKKASEKAAEEYKKSVNSFLVTGTKNIWVPDVAWKHPITEFKDFSSALNKDLGNINEDAYNEITSSLDDEKDKPNGFFVLVILSIGVMLLSQIVMNKSQKTQMELQSVEGADGQAAQTQKMMTWMMPIMFGIFAFIYTAAFSIYMIISSLASTISTILINLCVEKKFERDMEKLEQERLRKRYGHSVDKL